MEPRQAGREPLRAARLRWPPCSAPERALRESPVPRRGGGARLGPSAVLAGCAGPGARGRPPSPTRAPHAAEAAAPPGSSQPPRSGSAAANKDASHWPRRGPLPQQGRRRLGPAAPRPPRRTRAMLTVRRCGARPIRARGRGARGAAGAREASA